MRQQIGRHAGVHDRTDMGAAVAEPRQGRGVEQQLPRDRKIAVHIVGDRAVEEAVQPLRQVVVGHLLGRPARARGDRLDALVLRRLVIGFRAEDVHPVPARDGAHA